MRTIERHTVPDCLADQSENQDWEMFMGSQCHNTVDANLRQEQQALCCYCESEMNQNNSHIEHMEPRRVNRQRTYDHSNLALSCNGGRIEHCGHYKDNKKKNSNYTWNANLFAIPHHPATSGMFKYLHDGSIMSATANSTQTNYMIGYLGLDCPRLNERRKQHARTLIDTLGDQPDPTMVDWLRQEYLKPGMNGQLHSFYSLSKMILET